MSDTAELIPADLGNAVVTLSPDTPAERVVEIVVALHNAEAAVKAAKETLKQGLMEWLGVNRSLTIGTVRYYVGTKTEVIAGDTAKLLDALLDATGGDFQQVADLLKSQPFKHGACKAVLGDAWSDHFTEVVKEDMKTGKPLKEVKSVDTRFVK